MSDSTVWISCGVLHAELEELLRLGKIGGELLFLDSMLHMVPQELETMLTAALERSTRDCLKLWLNGCERTSGAADGRLERR